MVNDGERMNKHLIDIPARITLIPLKRPCTTVRINPGDTGPIVMWENKNVKHQKIGPQINEFIEDTKHFVEILGLEMIQALGDPHRWAAITEKAINAITHYFMTWGTFIKGGDNKITFIDLCYSCFAAYISLNLWNKTYIFDNLRHFIDPSNHQGMPEEGKITSWYSGLLPIDNHNRIWLPETKETRYDNYSSYYLRIGQPSKKDYNEKYRDNHEELIKYVKGEILKSISKYMSRQMDVRVPSMKFDHGFFSFGLKTDNLLLAYLLYGLPEFLKEEIRLCGCGCGNPVPGGKKYIQGHYSQVLAKREKNPDRILKAWVRRRKSLGHFTQEQCDYYYSVIDKEIRKGTDDKDIRVKLKKLMEEGKQNV